MKKILLAGIILFLLVFPACMGKPDGRGDADKNEPALTQGELEEERVLDDSGVTSHNEAAWETLIAYGNSVFGKGFDELVREGEGWYYTWVKPGEETLGRIESDNVFFSGPMREETSVCVGGLIPVSWINDRWYDEWPAAKELITFLGENGTWHEEGFLSPKYYEYKLKNLDVQIYADGEDAVAGALLVMAAEANADQMTGYIREDAGSAYDNFPVRKRVGEKWRSLNECAAKGEGDVPVSLLFPNITTSKITREEVKAQWQIPFAWSCWAEGPWHYEFYFEDFSLYLDSDINGDVDMKSDAHFAFR